MRAWRMRARGMAAAAAAVSAIAMSVAAPSSAHGSAVRPARSPQSAAPSGGRPLITSAACRHGAHNCGRAGYQARAGEGFRYARALITVPAHTGTTISDPSIYVALDRSTSRAWGYARAGIRPCENGGPRSLACPCGDTSGWELYAELRAPGARMRASAWVVPSTAIGKTASASVYYSQARHTIRVRLAAAGGPAHARVVTAPHVRYARAQALADWAGAAGSPRPSRPVARHRCA